MRLCGGPLAQEGCQRPVSPGPAGVADTTVTAGPTDRRRTHCVTAHQRQEIPTSSPHHHPGR